ncbi:hypothetical protein [Deinococcus radiophilus]|uniref:hypothetical protein n=1 Tax=Deinococcus radiophilus TaxID=32062 RepID=UPI003620FFC0
MLVADTNPANIAQARMEGLGGHYGSLLSEAADRIPMEGIGNLLALTPNDEANTLTTRKYEKSFGRAHVFQLYPGVRTAVPRSTTITAPKALFQVRRPSANCRKCLQKGPSCAAPA